jgi:hypothetical protein
MLYRQPHTESTGDSIEEMTEKSLSQMTNDAIATLAIDVAANVFSARLAENFCRIFYVWHISRRCLRFEYRK